MSEDASELVSDNDLATRVESFRVPVLAQPPNAALSMLPEVAFTVDCRGVDELARLLHPFVDGDQLILPAHPLLTIGDERALRIDLSGPAGTVLRGTCGAIELLSTPGGLEGRKHVRVQLLGLDAGGSDLLERIGFHKRRASTPLATTRPAGLAQLSRLFHPGEVTPTPVEATAILDSADLEALPARRRPPPLPPSPASIARRASVLARIDRPTVRVARVLTPDARTPVVLRLVLPTAPLTTRPALRGPLSATLLLVVMAGLVGGLMLWG